MVCINTSLRVIGPRTHDFARAGKLLERFDLGLRAADAPRLAIALEAGANAMATLDGVLGRACEASGLACVRPA